MTWGNIGNAKFVNQFKNYLADINSIDELAYIINTNKASISQVKTSFKNMMYNSNPNSTFNGLTAQGQEIFNAIWSKSSLRNDLFGSITSKADAELDFIDLISELDDISINNPKLYSFIKSE